ncbi:MAG: glycerol-3-phosphate dehydrogenase/oxidase [Verrucomicrobia bacterium]|nr:glycerol-3-phosphate dehydrogenase/oxidase [Verrucomicrobiota bacterium]
MRRDDMLNQLDAHADHPWDFVIIGGGATGLGIAVDAASRGYDTLLLEQSDFAKGTSSKSTKLVHGGVRYLAQGDVSLVLEALRERGRLRQNAPHLVHDLKFLIPNYTWWDGPFYTLGMKLYDAMAGKLGLGQSIHISKAEALAAIPNLSESDLQGGVIYHDGQFDDARLAINLAQTAANHGATLLNYMPVTGLIKDAHGSISGVTVTDAESGTRRSIQARAVINGTGVFVDAIVGMDTPGARRLVAPSQGVHIVLAKEFLRGDAAIMIPHTDDGRVLFAVPWHDRVIVGTTDTPVNTVSLEPRAQDPEIDFILNTASRYLTHDPTRHDVLSVFAGLRPLAAPEDEQGSTKEISRGHKIVVAPSGLITILGGKWTTYRQMAEDVIDKAQMALGLNDRECRTTDLPIHGAQPGPIDTALAGYGSDAVGIRSIMADAPALAQPLHARLPYTGAEVVWACRHEMARTVEDVLARRTRALLLDAKASIDAAADVARLMATETGADEAWQQEQIKNYRAVASGYVLASSAGS